MNQKDRVQLFNGWAQHYDRSIHADGNFPFDGYERVLDAVVRTARAQPGMTILDLGIGTGNLAARFVRLGCDVWGIDFSSEMLAKVRKKLSQVVLVQADLLNGWPAELDRRFDRIVSGYVLHEFDLSTKVRLLQRLTQRHLAGRGSIVIGDIAFPTSQARERAHRKWLDLWDEEEHYWVADEAVGACKSVGLQVTYKQISSCGGVLVVETILSE
jgi:putative AdoMet-dependent methyltransferase